MGGLNQTALGCGILADGDGNLSVCAGDSGCSCMQVSAGGCGAVPSKAEVPKL